MLSRATLVALLFTPAVASAHPPTRWETPSSLVTLSVDIDGRAAPLYAAVDGSGRYYVEARRGAAYEIKLTNRSGERLGVVLAVDGLNVISGDLRRTSGPGRMYVLDPWDTTVVSGWRTSLDEVQRFTFVDEQRSYAARSGKANAKMGWIEAAIYRERRPAIRERITEAPPASVPPPARGQADGAPAPEAKAQEQASRDDAYRRDEGAKSRAFPGTGWGPSREDHAVVVSFEPQPEPSQRIAVRYEYRSGLVALGILPNHSDRLGERDRGEGGFARPPVE